MAVEDKAMAVQARHALARTAFDITQVNISCSKGVVEISGYIKRPREHRGSFSPKQEIENLKKMVQHVRGVREVVTDRLRIQE